MSRLLVRMAWASLCVRATRSFMVVLMISVSLWSLLLMQGIYDGMTEQMISNAISSDSGDLSLFARGYRLDPSLENMIPDTFRDGRRITDTLYRDSRVRSFVKRLQQNGVVATARYSRNAGIRGVDLSAEETHGRLRRSILAGEYGFGTKGRGAILGYGLAEKLHVTVGSKIIVSCQNRDAEVVSTALKVTGIIKTNNMALDDTTVFMALERAGEFFGAGRASTQISVMTADASDAGNLQKDLLRSFPELDVLRWDELYPALMQSRVIMKGFRLVVSLIIFTVAGLGIVAVMMVSIMERRREIGVMLALGTRFSQIRIMVLIESLIMGLSGFAVGALAGLGSLLYFRTFGLDLRVFSDAFEEFGMDAVTYALLHFEYFATPFLAIVSASVISVYFPLRMLAKGSPVKIINEI